MLASLVVERCDGTVACEADTSVAQLRKRAIDIANGAAFGRKSASPVRRVVVLSEHNIGPVYARYTSREARLPEPVVL